MSDDFGGDGTFEQDEPGGIKKVTTRRTVDGRVSEHVERRDANNQVIQSGDRTMFTDSDGIFRVESTSSATDPQSGVTTTEERHSAFFPTDSADGQHEAHSTQTTFHEVTTEPNGNITTTDGVEGRDAHGNFSRTDSATDSNTGLTTVTTTTTDANGDGTRHTTMVDANGDPVLDPDGNPFQDETEDVHGEPDIADHGHDDLFNPPPPPEGIDGQQGTDGQGTDSPATDDSHATDTSTDTGTDTGISNGTGEETGGTDTSTDTGISNGTGEETSGTDTSTDTGISNGTGEETGGTDTGSTTSGGTSGGGGEEIEIEHDPFFGQAVTKAAEEDE